jgi:hypothetical protein
MRYRLHQRTDPRCLQSLTWARRIVVIDSGSTDAAKWASARPVSATPFWHSVAGWTLALAG